MEYTISYAFMNAISRVIKDHSGLSNDPMGNESVSFNIPDHPNSFITVMKLPIDNLTETIDNYYSITYVSDKNRYPIDVMDVFFEKQRAIIRHNGKEAIITDQQRGTWIKPDHLLALINNVVSNNEELMTEIGGPYGHRKDRKGG